MRHFISTRGECETLFWKMFIIQVLWIHNTCIIMMIIVILYYKDKFNLCFNAHIVCIIKRGRKMRWGERCRRQKGKEVRTEADSIWLTNYSATLIFSQFITITISPNQPWSPSWPKGYLKSGWGGDDGTGFLPHIKTYLQTRQMDRERAWLRRFFYFLIRSVIVIIRKWSAKLTLDH